MTRARKPDDLRGHRRRPPVLLAAGAGGRFLEWARALSERHGRVAERYGLLDLVLIRRPPPVLLLRRQQLVTSRRFEPRVSLTVQPLLLRQTVVRERAFAPPAAPLAERSAASPAAPRPSPAPSAGPPVLLHLRSLVERLIGGRDAASLRAAESARGAGAGKEPRASSERAPAATPLQMVFRRADEADQFTQRGVRASAAETNAEMLLRRVVRQAQRVEERSDGPASLVTRRTAPAPPSIAERAAEFHAPPAAGATPWGGAAPPVVIEQITDQVMRQLDRRVVAARERMGRF